MRAAALALALAAALPVWGAVEGTVVNGTTNQPQGGAIVSLMQPGAGGMSTLGTTKADAAGRFHFDKDPQGPRIIQVIYSGVIYTEVAPPGMPANALTVKVYEPTRNADSAKLVQHLVILQPSGTDLGVEENFLFSNDSKQTFNDPAKGSAEVWVPEAGRNGAGVTITAPGGMPIRRDLEKTRTEGVYKIDYPVKPGETRFAVNYTLPAATPLEFEGRVLEKGTPTRLVAPVGVTLSGADIEPMGQEPTTQASIFNVKSERYKVGIEGTGSLGQPGAASNEDAGMPQIHEAPPRVYDRIWWILTLAMLILGVGAFLLYRRGEQAGGR